MHAIIVGLIAAVVAIVLYRWYMAREGAEDAPKNGGSGGSGVPISPKPTMTSTDYGGTTGKQVYLMDGAAVTTDANGTKAEKDVTTNMTVNGVEDRRRKIINPLERSRKSQRTLSDKMMMDEMRRSEGGAKMKVGDEDDETNSRYENDGLDCIASILTPEDVIPGYIPGKRTLVSLAMSE